MSLPNRYLRLKEFFRGSVEPAFRYRQILDAIFNQGITQFSLMHTLPRALREQLAETFGKELLSLTPIEEDVSSQANKWLFSLADGQCIETVAMRYRAGWYSYCISTQAGCGFGCQFCGTAAMGLRRNLTADEICDQALYFRLAGQPLNSLSFMGMGEALANPNLFPVLQCLTDPALFALSARRLTVSTIGLVPGIQRLCRDFPQVNLTFSMHSPFNEQRSQLIPFNRRYPIEEVMASLDEHIARNRRKVYVAYLLLRDVNDSQEHAKTLAELLKRRGRNTRLYHVNIVRHNATQHSEQQFARPVETEIQKFRGWLEESGLKVTVRPSFGSEISAACGQLYAHSRDQVQAANLG
ncbi:MAG: 23S rRNA (adenine(2503)-C(8))-methyltransferase Cfr [Chloroflexi bacterium]|nr:23S rRNA (adenine(2503)-C(8))-methyltransferase Cfr [Chloroflexota bacterium]